MLTYKEQLGNLEFDAPAGIFRRRASAWPMRKTAIIIGAGFAGLSCAARLSSHSRNLKVLLFDSKPQFNFLPLLPDCLGRNIAPEFLTYGLEAASRRLSADFIREEVLALDLGAAKLATAAASYSYDYLVVASGSKPNFLGNAGAQSFAYALNNVEDARRIRSRLEKEDFTNLVICGGGYTGVELATNLARYFKNKAGKKIVIVERGNSPLAQLPQWMKDYASANLTRMGIQVLTGATIEHVFANRVELSGGRVLEEALVFWMPGVKTADFIQKLSVSKNPQGRINVDEYLQFAPGCFAAGDAANFSFRGSFLRMAVQFSIKQGAHAARNIINLNKARPLEKFRPLDLGYIVPMANNRSCGRTMGTNVRGVLATLLHFVMCIFRTKGWKNKMGLINNLLFKGGAK